VVERLERIRAVRDDIGRLLASDETATLEFKSSLRTPVGPPNPNDKRARGEIERALEYGVLKTLAAFLNTDGGVLVIGIADDGTIHGTEVDYPTLRRPSADGWRCVFDDLVSDHLGTEVMNYINLDLEPWHGLTIAMVRCSKREEPTWLGDDLFVRRTASTVKLSTRHALAWCRERQPQS
jgi:predicted HTH transcriptional regulator